jgi:hypothetical protein
MKYTTSLKVKLIYIFRINDMTHLDALKIGEATSDDDIFGLQPNSSALNKAAKNRINSYTQTAGIAYDLLHTELTIYNDKGTFKSFTDTEVHDVLKRSGIKKKTFNIDGKANEWFITDLETAKKAITAVKKGHSALNSNEVTKKQSPIIFRPEQADAIKKTKKKFIKGKEMLWFAKMRFGKTLSALQVSKELDFKRTLILTHRPVVDAGWFEDFGKIFYDSPQFHYGSKNNGKDFQNLEKLSKKDENRYVYFVSMQDLRGSSLVGGYHEKNEELYETPWNFIIVDEAHEGTQTELGQNVLALLTTTDTKVLHLSGTPFNLIDHYKGEEIFTWDYVMEQKAKKEWDETHFGDPNPYASLPRLNIFTFDLGKLMKQFEDEELAFNFREFFRVNKQGELIHKSDVSNFLDLICKKDNESNYPYSTETYRNNFRHSLWTVPGVKEAKALSALMSTHPVFAQFTIVNVAGEGDVDENKELEKNADALKKLNKAIGPDSDKTYTITLSCGRLTTGVSVKPWTAVFMLSGSYNTSASAYMQTIFRVQTPATINGREKQECYVFDFAPDRTLKVVAEAAKVSAKAGKTTNDDRETMREFLNFCPIIASDGSKMKTYDVNAMLEQLKKVYIERVIRHGFEDSHLYNDNELMTLDEVDLKDFDDLKGKIGSTKAMPTTKDIDINKQGFSEEEYEKLENAQKKPKKELTDEEKRLLEKKKAKKKQKEAAISILRGISIRMPLLIYGAEIKNEEKELTIDNFTDLIDSKSWKEFMPAGVAKATFHKFKKYYDKDVFRAAGRRIRAMARAADILPVEERIERITDIFATFRNPDKETVLTPWRVVNRHMGDCIGGYVFFDEKYDKKLAIPRYVSHGEVTQDIFTLDANILEINSKSGLYPLYIAYTFYRNAIAHITKDEQNIELQQQMWDKVVAKNIFVICKTPMAKSITKRTLVGFRDAKVNTHYFEDLVRQITERSDKFVAKVTKGQSYWNANKDNNMKFKAIVGNPPYMEMDGGAQASAKPIYNQFVEIAKQINPDYTSMIMPARWYTGGKGLDNFREMMLNDKSIAVLHDFLNPEEVFPGTNIRGGICYFLWKKKHNNQEESTQVITHQRGKEPVVSKRKLKSENIDIFIRHTIAVTIINKIKKHDSFESFEKQISSRKPFGLDGSFIKNKKFHSTNDNLREPLLCYGKGKIFGYVEDGEIKHNRPLISKYKVFTPYANNLGTELNDDNLNTFVGAPNSICTETYIMMGIKLNLSKTSAISLSKYFTTKFSRFLHSLLKSSQHGTSKTYRFVPVQDFTSNSDINWSKSITEIDQQLYAKYKFTREEIDFIESMIKPMG